MFWAPDRCVPPRVILLRVMFTTLATEYSGFTVKNLSYYRKPFGAFTISANG